MSGRESDSLSDEDKDFCNSDDDHVYSESDDEELLGTDDPLPDVSDILFSERTWDMLTGHEVSAAFVALGLRSNALCSW